jgi:hypothetical protein
MKFRAGLTTDRDIELVKLSYPPLSGMIKRWEKKRRGHPGEYSPSYTKNIAPDHPRMDAPWRPCSHGISHEGHGGLEGLFCGDLIVMRPALQLQRLWDPLATIGLLMGFSA